MGKNKHTNAHTGHIGDKQGQCTLMQEWEDLYETRQGVIQSVAQSMDRFGMTPSVGRLYGTMFFHDAPMTLDEMRDELGMSKTSMSTGVRSLLEIHMVRQTWKKGERKDLYAAEMDWYKTFVELFTTKWRKSVEDTLHQILQAKHDLDILVQKTEDQKLKMLIESDLEKMKHAQEYYEWLLRLVDCFDSGEIFDLVPKREKQTDTNP